MNAVDPYGARYLVTVELALDRKYPGANWNEHFVAGLAALGLALSETREGHEYAMMAPIPPEDGGPPYPYPSYIVWASLGASAFRKDRKRRML